MPGQADIGIRVFLDNAASAGLGQINAQLVGMVATLGRASDAIKLTQGQLMAIAAVAGAAVAFFVFASAIKQSYDEAANFQTIMFGVAVATKTSLEAAMQYAPALMNLAASSIYTSAQIAQGIVIMGRSGYTLDEILGKTDHMAQAAINLGEATRSTALEGFTLLSQVMQAYGANASQATHYSDLLQFAFEHQTGTVSQLQSAFANITPVAAMLHIPFDQLVAAIDVVGPAMGSTTKAGTALRYAIAGMASPTAAATAELASLGIITSSTTTPAVKAFGESLVASGAASQDFVNHNLGSVAGLKALFAAAQGAGQIPLDQSFSDWAYQSGLMSSQFFDAKGHALDLTGMLDVLAAHLKGLKGDALAAAEKAIFSVRGGQGIQDLLQNMDKYNALMKTLSSTNDNAGVAQKRANDLMTTAAAASQALSSSIVDLKVAIGLALLPVVAQVATSLNGMISGLRAIVQQTGPAAANFLLLGAAFSAIALVGGVVGLIIAGIGTTMAIFVGVMLASAVGIIAFSAGIALLVSWFQRTHGAVDALRSTLAVLGLIVVSLIGMIAGFAAMVGVASLVIALNNGTLQAAVRAWVMDAAATTLNILSKVRAMAVTAALAALKFAMEIPSILAAAGAWLVQAAAMMLALAPFILIGVLVAGMVVGLALLIAHLIQTGAMTRFFAAAWATIGPPILAAGNAIKGAFMDALNQLRPAWAQLVAAFNSARPALMFLGAILGGIIVAALILLVGIIVGVVVALAQLIAAAVRVAAGVIQAFMGLVSFFFAFFGLLHGLFTLNGAQIQASWAAMGHALQSIATGLWSAIVAVFVGAFNIIKGFIMGFVNVVVGLFHALSSTLVGHSIVPDMMNAIMAVFSSAFAVIGGIVHAGISLITSVFSTMQFMVTSVVTIAMSAVRALFTGGISAAAGVVMNGVAMIIAHFESMPGPVGNVARLAISLIMGLGNGVLNAASLIGGAVSRVVGAFQSMAGGIGGAISGAIGWVNNLIGAISRIPSIGGGFHIPGFANGAIVTSPTLAVVGEGSEPEMILPMSQYQAALQGAANMSKTGGNGQGGTIVNNFIVDGKVVASSVMNTLTGQLQMNGMGRALR